MATDLSLVENHSTPSFTHDIGEGLFGGLASPRLSRHGTHETPSFYSWQMNKLAGLKTPIRHSIPQAQKVHNRPRAQTASVSRPAQSFDRHGSALPFPEIFAHSLQQNTLANALSKHPPHERFEALKQDSDIEALPNVYLSQMNKLYQSQSQRNLQASPASSSPLLRNTQGCNMSPQSEPSLKLQEGNNCLQWPTNRHLMMLRTSQEPKAGDRRLTNTGKRYEPPREVFAPAEARLSNTTSSPLHGGAMTVTSLQASPTPSPDWSSRPIRPLHTFTSQRAPIEPKDPQLQSDRHDEVDSIHNDDVCNSDYDDLFRGLKDEDFDDVP